MARKSQQPAALEDGAVEGILERIRDARNFDFRNYKRATLRRRIERRMTDRRCKSLRDYVELLEREPAEYDALISALLIKVTSFFRDQETWDSLSKKVIPQLLAEKRPGEDVRVWSAGCATGEEAFSLAILLADAMGPAFHNQDVKVFGTDLDEKAIAVARRGIYPAEALEGLPKGYLQQYFVEDAGGFCVRKEIRRNVVFGVNNLVSDAPISRLDLLVCRNVFIYLDAPLQKRVLTRFHYALRRHGILVLGKSELIPFAAKIFEPVDLHRRIYRKDGKGDAAVSQERLVSLLEQETLARAVDDGRTELGAVDQFHRDVLQSLRVPVIATAPDGTVLLWNGPAAALWGRGEADVAGKKLPALGLPGLTGELLIEKTAAVRSGSSEVETATGVLARPGDPGGIQLSVEVAPLRDAAHELAGLLYTVHDVSANRALEDELRRANEDRQSAVEELQTINEELQSANEELETTNEELQSANEELQTTNEELQSTNEELETTNAELDATNRELAHRTEEMNALTYMHRTIIRSLQSAVVVLDPGGRVRLWNLAAERLLGISEDEADAQLFWTLHVPALGRAAIQRIRKSLSQNAPLRAEEVEYELPTGQTGRATVAAVPILDNGTVLGSVVIFDDNTKLASALNELRALKAANGKRRRDR